MQCLYKYIVSPRFRVERIGFACRRTSWGPRVGPVETNDRVLESSCHVSEAIDPVNGALRIVRASFEGMDPRVYCGCGRVSVVRYSRFEISIVSKAIRYVAEAFAMLEGGNGVEKQ